MKKIISILLAIITAFSISVTAFAGDKGIELNLHKNGEKIILGVNMPEYFHVNGLDNEAELTVSVENEDILTATVVTEEKNYAVPKATKVCITGKKAGETTLTATASDGTSSKFTVKVLPKGIYSLELKLRNFSVNLALGSLISELILSGFITEIITFIFSPIINIFS